MHIPCLEQLCDALVRSAVQKSSYLLTYLLKRDCRHCCKGTERKAQGCNVQYHMN